jgi:hypothetical protein
MQDRDINRTAGRRLRKIRDVVFMLLPQSTKLSLRSCLEAVTSGKGLLQVFLPELGQSAAEILCSIGRERPEFRVRANALGLGLLV